MEHAAEREHEGDRDRRQNNLRELRRERHPGEQRDHGQEYRIERRQRICLAVDVVPRDVERPVPPVGGREHQRAIEVPVRILPLEARRSYREEQVEESKAESCRDDSRERQVRSAQRRPSLRRSFIGGTLHWLIKYTGCAHANGRPHPCHAAGRSRAADHGLRRRSPANVITSRYGPIERPALPRILATRVAPLAHYIEPRAYAWRPVAIPYVGGDPITYLQFAREMRAFYQGHVREPLFLVITRAGLWFLDGQDVGISF